MNGKAKEHQDERQRLFPIREPFGPGRVEGLFEYLTPAMPEPVVQRYTKGELAVYGVSAPKVMVETEPLSAEDDVVEMSVNLMRFLYACVRTLCGNARVVHKGGRTEPANIKLKQLAHYMEGLRTCWDSGQAFDDVPYTFDEISLHSSQINMAEQLTQFAETFALAHEIGHIVIRHGLQKVFLAPDLERSEAEELWADGFAARSVLQISKENEKRDACAGSLVALRIFDWLERVGCIRHPGYPPTARRMAELKAIHRQWFGDPDQFTYHYTIAEAFDRQFDMLESRVLGTPLPPIGAERLLITFLAMAEECIAGRLSHAEMQSKISRMVHDASKPAVDELAELIKARTLRFSARCQSGKPLVVGGPPGDVAFSALVPILGEMLNIEFAKS
jgi:IrrE N-terminal-like domain